MLVLDSHLGEAGLKVPKLAGETRCVLHSVGLALLRIRERCRLRRYDVLIALLDAHTVVKRRALRLERLLGRLHLRLGRGVLARSIAHVSQGGETCGDALACPAGGSRCGTSGPRCCLCGAVPGGLGCAPGSTGIARGVCHLVLRGCRVLLGSVLLDLFAFAPSHEGSFQNRVVRARDEVLWLQWRDSSTRRLRLSILPQASTPSVNRVA